MKKIVLSVVALFFGLSQSFSQADSFSGKWDFVIAGTPNGDAKMVADLIRTDGKLGGTLSPIDGSEPINITNIEENGESFTMYFSTQGYDINAVMKIVDGDNLKGSVMDMFDATAVRIKDNDYFTGKWDVVFVGTPNGDAKMIADLQRIDGKLAGKLIPEDGSESINITQIEEESDRITLYFSAQGYDVNVVLVKEDSDNLKGSLMDMFDAKASRSK